MANSFLLLLALLVLPVASGDGFRPAIGSRRSILRALGGTGGSDLPDVAVELDATNFGPMLESYKVRFVVVEFFASWCPACRNYKVQYEKVARLFNGPDAVHPGIIVMARVDCAVKMNKDICNRFSISHFPQLLWGPPRQFVDGSWDPKKAQNDIKSMDDVRPADHLLNWINKELGSSFSLDGEKYESTQSLNTSNTAEISEAIYDVEESTAIAFDIILDRKMINSENRAPLIKFLQLLVAHHPSKRCRRGSAEHLMNLNELWPPSFLFTGTKETSAGDGNDVLKNYQICGKEVPRRNWKFCRGSKHDTRGFSCGLWVLIHSLSVRVGDGESHSTFTVVCDFIHNFFGCEDCRQHFYDMCSRVSTPFNRTRDLALWFWSTHNKVNLRLQKEENELGTGDPKFPKMTWPSKELCPSCYLSLGKKSSNTNEIEWNMDEVFSFLVKYYGKMLISSYKDTSSSSIGISEPLIDDTSTSTHVVTVPLGAAMGIAIASCAFGALAWFWRTHQKSRKYFYQTSSLKTV